MSAASSRFVLRQGVRFVPMSDLDPQVRQQIDSPDDHVAVTRIGARAPSTVVDPEAAALLEGFGEPRSLAEALILYARPRDLDPEEVFDEAVELVQRFLRQQVLRVDSEDEEAAEDPDRLSPGETLELNGGVQSHTAHVVETVAVLEDVEVMLVRLGERADEGGWAALKITRPGIPSAASFEHEAAILDHLAGHDDTPHLLAHGQHGERRFLLLEWCAGTSADAAAAELRGPAGGRYELLALLRSIAEAYAGLHGLGVVHGDVHPRNILVQSPESVRLIDFGLARRTDHDGSRTPPRGGVGFYYEPEWARALLAGKPSPPACHFGEQYAVAALAYQLATGSHRRDFSLGRDEMLAELSQCEPLPFERRGVEPWPDLEDVLARALSVDPDDRFDSMDSFARALADVSVPERRRSPSLRGSRLAALEREVSKQLAEDGDWFRDGLPEPPTASVNYGAAGIAFGLHRLAGRREDAELLCRAELWIDRAEAEIGRDEGFYNADIEITPETVGRGSPFHGASGIHAVRSWIDRASNDPDGQAMALERFLESGQDRVEGLDVTLGHAGLLLVAAFLLDSVPAERLDPEPLLAFGRERRTTLWQQLEAMDGVSASPVETLGAAHGWAGFLHACLEWSRASGDPLPAGLPRRLDELAHMARPGGRGLHWPWQNTATGGSTMPGWCNGSAGYVSLFLGAAYQLDEPRFLRLAEGAARNCWEAGDTAITLCCGLASRAWALLSLYRATEDTIWLRRAKVLAERAATDGAQDDEYPWSLYKGAFGLVVLAADLERPDESAQPLYEPEGWTRHAAATERTPGS